MKRLMVSLGCIAFITPVVSFSAIAFNPAAEESERFWIALGEFTPAQCNVACHFYSCNMTDEHSSSSVSPGVQEYDDGVHFCVDTGLCKQDGGEWHPDCFAPAPEAELIARASELLDAAIARHDTATIARLVRSAPRVFQVHVDRRAVQVVGCGEQVLAHYPVSIQMIDSLEVTSE